MTAARNREHAEKAKVVLRLITAIYGAEVETAVADFLTDLLHTEHGPAIDLHKLADRAKMHHDAEVSE